jgi:hypothetical protein
MAASKKRRPQRTASNGEMEMKPAAVNEKSKLTGFLMSSATNSTRELLTTAAIMKGINTK